MDRTPEEIKKWLQCCQFDNEGCKNCDECPYLMNGCGSSKNYRDALAYIQQLEAQVPRWISVEKRLPPLGEVFICTRGNYVGVAWFHANRKFETGSGLMLDTKFVSHWMPLPKRQRRNTND